MRTRPARKPGQKVPLHLQRLLVGLDRERPPGWTDIALYLLDFAQSGRSNVNRMVKETRRRIRADGQRHDFTIGTKTPAWHGISAVLAPPQTPRLAERAHFLAHLNGLRHGATHWLGVAIEVSEDVMVPTAVVLAKPPFEQVVPADQVAPAMWHGPRRVAIER